VPDLSVVIANLSKAHIAANEGLRLHVYKDVLGIHTIGYGCNLQTGLARELCARFGIDYDNLVAGLVDLTKEQADAIFQVQREQAAGQAAHVFPALAGYPVNVQIVLTDLIFNMGPTRFGKFNTFIGLITRGDYIGAAWDLTNTLWYHQVGVRGQKNYKLLLAAK
jgi:GH24 family phage-related lysozyme (muramidase)